MSLVKQFEVGGVTYNVKRASAKQQDDVLPHITPRVLNALGAMGEVDPKTGTFAFDFFTLLPLEVKELIDEKLMSSFTKHGNNHMLSIKDFDGNLFNLNMLRAKVLIWNFEDFFDYWANEAKSAIDEAKSKIQSKVE